VAAVLAADGVFGAGELTSTVLLGELGLDGRVRPVRACAPCHAMCSQYWESRLLIIFNSADRKVFRA
jgi:magnesium chelatase family protein